MHGFEVNESFFSTWNIFIHNISINPMRWGLTKKYTFIYERQNLKSVEGRRILNTTTSHKYAINTHISLIRQNRNKSRGYLRSNKLQKKYHNPLNDRFNVFFIIFLQHYWNLFTFCLPWKLLIRRKCTTKFSSSFTFLHNFRPGSSLTSGCICDLQR